MLAGGVRGGPRHLPGSAAAAETLLDCNINKKKRSGFDLRYAAVLWFSANKPQNS